MAKYKVYVPIHTGFEVTVEANSENEAIDMVLNGEFDEETNEQLFEGQQVDGDVEIIEVKE